MGSVHTIRCCSYLSGPESQSKLDGPSEQCVKPGNCALCFVTKTKMRWNYVYFRF